MISKAITPRVLWGNDIHDMEQDQQRVVELPRPVMPTRMEATRLGPRCCWRDRELAIPEPTMVRADVAHDAQVMNPRPQLLMVEAETASDRGTNPIVTEIPVPAGEQAERHNLARSPERR